MFMHHPIPPAHPTHIDPVHRHQIRALALGKITGIFLQRREILKLEILMLCLRLIFFFKYNILMSPWDLFGRTLFAGLHEYISYLKKKKNYKQMLLKKNIL